MLRIDKTETRGLTRVSGLVPNGTLRVERSAVGTAPFILRGASSIVVSENAFSLEDTEAPVGIPITYTAFSRPTDRLIQQNLVLTPTTGRGQLSWTAGAGRTFSVSGTTGRITSNPGGTGAGVPGRTIAEVGVAQLQPNSVYLMSGKIKFKTPDVWVWQDAQDFGTWQSVKTAKATWRDVLSSVPSGSALTDLTSISVSLSSGTTNYVAPVVAYTIPLARSNEFVPFSLYFTTPSAIPPAARLRVLHGTNTREYSISWEVTQFQIIPAAQATKAWRLEFLDGDQPLPSRPVDYLMQDATWEDQSGDALISWDGVPGNSASRFIGPSYISTSATETLYPPAGTPCSPVLLSDPVSSSLALWLGLAAIDDLSYAARASILSVINRPDYINSSSVRQSADSSVQLYTNTLDERHIALTLFRPGRVLLLRNPDPAYPESMWYLGIGNITESRTISGDARRPERTWDVPFAVVERPTGMIEASTGTTWQRIKDVGRTWADLRTQHTDWLAVTLDAP